MNTKITDDVDALAEEIRRVDGNHDLGATALAEALMPFIQRQRERTGEAVAMATIRKNEYGEYALEIADNDEWKKLPVGIEFDLFISPPSQSVGEAVPEPEWISKLRHDVIFNGKATHNYTFTRDEVQQLLSVAPSQAVEQASRPTPSDEVKEEGPKESGLARGNKE